MESIVKTNLGDLLVENDIKELHFNQLEYVQFNKLLCKSKFSMEELIIILERCIGWFIDYDISVELLQIIDKYINRINRYDVTWKQLTDKPDYNFCVYKERTLPYFNSESKEWKKANIDANIASSEEKYALNRIQRKYQQGEMQLTDPSIEPSNGTIDKKSIEPSNGDTNGTIDKKLIEPSNGRSIEPLNGTINGTIDKKSIENTNGRSIVSDEKKTSADRYPKELFGDAEDFSQEKKIAIKYNNFLEWNILQVNEYPDMQFIIRIMVVFYRLKLYKQLISYFCRLLLSPKTCHVVKEPMIWQLITTCIDKQTRQIIDYCCYYAMYILRQEETIMFSNVRECHRVIYNLSNAYHMPTFNHLHIEQDPYIQQLTDNRLVNCMPFYLREERKINDYKEFNRRFSLATGGAFKNIDLKALSAAITGSILIPCVHKSPLENGFDSVDWQRDRRLITMEYPYMVDTPDNISDYEFLNYLEYYYPSYVSLSDEDFLKETSPVNKMQRTDICYEDESINRAIDIDQENNSQVKIQYNQPIDIDQENNSQVKIQYNQMADIDISITSRSIEEFKKNAMILYEKIKENCSHRGPVYIKEIKTISQIKYKIYGIGIPRPMDVFKIPYHPAKMVKKFHVNQVKMYYNGDVMMFRACHSAIISGVSDQYKWFSCNKVPADVLLKYAQRGFSIILNEKERNALNTYIMENERWSRMIRFLGIEVHEIYNMIKSNHSFFRPGIYDSGIRMGLRNFERNTPVYNQFIPNEYVDYNTAYAELKIKSLNKLFAPNISHISACLNYETDQQ